MSNAILWLLQRFLFVRDLQARLREAVDARIEAERQRDELAAELAAMRDELARAKGESNETLKSIADVLCRRFLGHSLAATPTVEEIEADDPALQPLNFGPKLEPSGKRAARVRSDLQRDIDEYFASEPDPRTA